MARAAVPGRALPGLEPMLGPRRCADLQAALARRTIAAMLELGRVVVACEGEVPVPAEAGRIEQVAGDPGSRIRAAVAYAYECHGGPIIAVGTDVPRLGRGHVAAAMADMEGGADASFGPALDGGYYMTALPRPRDELFALTAEQWKGTDVLAHTLGLAGGAKLEVGMLRMERRLRTPADARAMLADPLFPGELREVIVDEP